MRKWFQRVVLAGFAAAAVCGGVLAAGSTVRAKEVYENAVDAVGAVEVAEGCLFDAATGALTITADYSWLEDYPWDIGAIDPAKIITANVDLTGTQNVGFDESWCWGAEMFYECSNLQTVRFSGNVTTKLEVSMNGMFFGCSSLKSVDLSGYAGAYIVSMREMFKECTSLESVNFKGLDTSNVISMEWMFYRCNSIKSLDLSNFDFRGIATEYDVDMFDSLDSLEVVKVPANLPYEIILPWKIYFDEKDACYWKDASGTVCSVMSAGLSVPMTYTRVFASTQTGDSQTSGSGTVQNTVQKPKGTSISSIKPKRRGFTVKWKKKKGIDGYYLQFSTNKKFKSKYEHYISKKKTQVTEKRLKSKKKYYVRICTYKKLSGRLVYSKWSKIKSVKTK